MATSAPARSEAWGTPIEIERRRRIRVAVWAYAYEVMAHSLVSDADFDREAALVDPKTSTGHAKLDAFFRDEFAAHTGQWVHKHPDTDGLRKICKRLIAGK